MPVSGTDLGTVFNQGYGTGTSEILDSSAMVNVARDLYGQENQWNKLAQQEKKATRSQVDKTIATPVDFWQRDKSVLMPKYNELLDKAARFRSKVDDPFTGYSNDPEVQQFQKDWREFKGMASQSALERTEFEKYQNKLFDKNSNSLADDSKKELENYYGKPITDRYGKVPPSMRVKDPHANIYSFASDLVKASEKKEYTTDDIDNLVNLQGDPTKNPEGAAQVANYAQQAYANYTPEMRKAAEEKYGTDPQGNFNYAAMGKDILRDSLQSVANIQNFDVSKELYDIAKQSADFTDKRRGSDGTLFLDKNTGAVAGETKASIRRQLDLKLKSNNGFAKAFRGFYEPMIKTDDLKGMSPEQAAKEKYNRALEMATGDAYNTKDRSSQAVARMSPRITINTGDKNKNNMSNVFEEFMNDTLNNDNNARTYGVIKGQPLGEYGYIKEIKPQSFAIQGEGVKRPNLKVVLVDKNGTETTQDFDMTKPINKSMFGHALEKGLQAKESLDSYNSDGKQNDPLGIKKSTTKTAVADPLGLRN